MNSRLDALHSYPFTKLRALLESAGPPPADIAPIDLSIGEPKHAAPACVGQALCNNLGGLSVYPATKGDPALRAAISQCLARPYSIPAPNPVTQVLPVLSSRAAMCPFAATVLHAPQHLLAVCPYHFCRI